MWGAVLGYSSLWSANILYAAKRKHDGMVILSYLLRWARGQSLMG